VNSKLDYTIKYCSCGKHAIDKKFAIGHAENRILKPVEVTLKFTEKCLEGGWYIESGILV
jgi:hypothetical protein